MPRPQVERPVETGDSAGRVPQLPLRHSEVRPGGEVFRIEDGGLGEVGDGEIRPLLTEPGQTSGKPGLGEIGPHSDGFIEGCNRLVDAIAPAEHDRPIHATIHTVWLHRDRPIEGRDRLRVAALLRENPAQIDPVAFPLRRTFDGRLRDRNRLVQAAIPNQCRRKIGQPTVVLRAVPQILCPEPVCRGEIEVAAGGSDDLRRSRDGHHQTDCDPSPARGLVTTAKLSEASWQAPEKTDDGTANQAGRCEIHPVLRHGLHRERDEARCWGQQDSCGHERKEGPRSEPEASSRDHQQDRGSDDIRPDFKHAAGQSLTMVEHERGRPCHPSQIEPDGPRLCQHVATDRGRSQAGGPAAATECERDRCDHRDAGRQGRVERAAHATHLPDLNPLKQFLPPGPVEGRHEWENRDGRLL